MPLSPNPAEVVRDYFAALSVGNMAGLAELLADDIRWHQPGGNSLSGLHSGKDKVFALFAAFMERSNGSFRIDALGPLLVNGDMVSATLHFRAERGDTGIAMAGIDVLRVKEGRIHEVWLFSDDQAAEDRFWN